MQWFLRTVSSLTLLGNVICFFKQEPSSPEAHMNVSEIITYWGYTAEEYEVVTEDGYILLVYRIPHGKNESSKLAQKPVVYLQHGLLLTAGIWIANLPNNSLGFLLADAGYDVWMGNSRGNVWSRKHLYLDTDSKEFWAFSFDEMIKYDVPATIDFILKKTGQTQIYYAGHSQGTIIAFGAFSANLQLAQKIKMNFALAPFTTVKYTTSVARIVAYIPPTTFKMLFGEKDFLSIGNSNHISQYICQHQTIGTVCNNLLTLISGYNPKNLNESRLDVYLGQFPAGTSVQTMLHYGQAIRSGRFQAFDWGSPYKNIQHYNQPTPPLYRVEDMKVPTAMWSGGRDILSDPIDVAMLEPKISNLIYHKKIPDNSHMDFVIGLNAPNEVFNEILELMNEGQ